MTISPPRFVFVPSAGARTWSWLGLLDCTCAAAGSEPSGPHVIGLEPGVAWGGMRDPAVLARFLGGHHSLVAEA